MHGIRDVIFAVGGLALCVAMLPALRGKIVTPMGAALTLGSVLGVFALTYLTMGFLLSAASAAVQAILWGVVGWKARKASQAKPPHWYSGWDKKDYPPKRYRAGEAE